MSIEKELIYLILIIAAAKVGGELAERIGQPAVAGELLIGVLLGMTALRGATTSLPIVLLATIGIILLLFEVGLESKLSEFVKIGKSAILVAVIGVVVPFASGYALSYLIGGDYKLALFMGATLTATSVGITTRVLSDMGKMNMKGSKIILGAAVFDDILGLLVLSAVLQIIATGRFDPLTIAKAIVIALGFLVVAIWVGTRFAPVLTSFVRDLKIRGALVSASFVFCLALAITAKELGLAEIIGAFAAGLVLATTESRVKIHEQIKPLTDIFVSVFFVLVGLQVSLGSLNPLNPANRMMLLYTLLFAIVAVLGKLVAGLGVRERNVSKLIVGVGMVPRGEVGLIFASVGLREKIIDSDIYSMLIIVIFISTLIAPIWLKKLYQRNAATVSNLS